MNAFRLKKVVQKHNYHKHKNILLLRWHLCTLKCVEFINVRFILQESNVKLSHKGLVENVL